MSTQIPVAAIEAFRSPFENDVWRCGVVNKSMVEQAIAEGSALSYDAWKALGTPSPDNVHTQAQHAARVAYLVHHGWDDAISIDVGVPSLGHFLAWPYEDGNHRICAAIIRGDTHIAADVCGDIDHAADIFGVPIEEMTEEGEA